MWQVGGQVAEDGVHMSEPELIGFARRELEAVLPGIDLSAVEWSTYRIDRAEMKTPGGKRPSAAQVRLEGNVITAWPTKLALIPRLAKLIADRLGAPPSSGPRWAAIPTDWPRPELALPPWEVSNSWDVSSSR